MQVWELYILQGTAQCLYSHVIWTILHFQKWSERFLNFFMYLHWTRFYYTSFYCKEHDYRDICNSKFHYHAKSSHSTTLALWSLRHAHISILLLLKCSFKSLYLPELQPCRWLHEAVVGTARLQHLRVSLPLCSTWYSDTLVINEISEV